MRVVVFASNKGGVGKTTLATVYAEAALLAEMRVACLDLDIYQENMKSNLHRFVEGGGSAPGWVKSIKEKGDYDICVVDTPPSLGAATMEAVKVADYVLCPLTPNLDAIKGLKPIFEERKSRLHTVGVILNMFASHKRVPDLWVHHVIWTELKNLGVPIIAVLKESTAIRRNLLFGDPWDKGLHPVLTSGYFDFLKFATKGEDMNAEEKTDCEERSKPDISRFERIERLFGSGEE
jgi:cellulose biosynthesis protein BcsQ